MDQMLTDEIREEIEEKTVDDDDDDNKGEEVANVEEASFHGDSSNIDSSDNELVVPARRNRRIPPPSQTNISVDNEKEVLDGFADDEREGEDYHGYDDSQVLDMLKDLQEKEKKQLEEKFLRQDVEKAKKSGFQDNVEDGDSSSDGLDSADERMALSSCDEEEVQYPEFDEVTNMKDPHFSLGMLFSCGAVFRKAVRQHAIVHQRGIRLKENLKKKIKWICVDGCQWKCDGINNKGVPVSK